MLDASNQIHKQIVFMMQAAHAMETVLHTNKDAYKLPEEDATKFKDAAYAFVALNSAVGLHFHNQNVVLFNFTIKMHYLLHLGHVAMYINPRMAWCYMGEDAMHKLRKLVQSSHSGTAPRLIPSKVMKKYALALGLGLTDILLKP